MATLLIGYDVECESKPEITRHFLHTVAEVHAEHPCTLFLLGLVIEKNADYLKKVANNPMFDFQQHTYSHKLLKTICIDRRNGTIEVHKGVSLQEIEEEVAKTSELIRQEFGKECIGLTGPWGYYRGLADRPDILEVLHRLGIRFTRTYGRDQFDFQPVAFEIQPFWYDAQGFPDILEIPIHDWQDVYWRGMHGWDDIKGYSDHLLWCLDYVAQRNLVWSYASHDWSSILKDSDMTIIRTLLEAADKRGVKVQSYLDYYMEQKEKRNAQ